MALVSNPFRCLAVVIAVGAMDPALLAQSRSSHSPRVGTTEITPTIRADRNASHYRHTLLRSRRSHLMVDREYAVSGGRPTALDSSLHWKAHRASSVARHTSYVLRPSRSASVHRPLIPFGAGGSTLQQRIAYRDGFSYVLGRGTHTQAHTYFGFRPMVTLPVSFQDPAASRRTSEAATRYAFAPTDFSGGSNYLDLIPEIEGLLKERLDAPPIDPEPSPPPPPTIPYLEQADAAAATGDIDRARRLAVRAALLGSRHGEIGFRDAMTRYGARPGE